MDVELRHLRAFQVVAQELNFTRAAGRLHLTQQALSAQIRDLEVRAGAELFIRTTRSVTLTAAGEVLLGHVPGILARVGQALAETREAAGGQRGHLTVGLAAVAGLDLTPRVLRAFAARRPDAEVAVRNITFGDSSGGLLSGTTDVSLAWLPVPDGVESFPLLTDPRLAVLAADHPLAGRDAIPATELALEPFVWVDEMDAAVRDYWTLGEFRGGRPVRVGARIAGFEELFAMVRLGRAVSASPASTLAHLPGPDIVTRRITGLPPAVLAVCRRIGDERPLVQAFLEVARERASAL